MDTGLFAQLIVEASGLGDIGDPHAAAEALCEDSAQIEALAALVVRLTKIYEGVDVSLSMDDLHVMEWIDEEVQL